MASDSELSRIFSQTLEKADEHTPTPWMVEPNAYGTWFVYRAEITETAPTGLKYRQLVCGGDGYRTLTAENAAFIVKAVNSHDALVKDLADAVKLLHDLLGLVPGSGEAAFAFVERHMLGDVGTPATRERS